MAAWGYVRIRYPKITDVHSSGGRCGCARRGLHSGNPRRDVKSKETRLESRRQASVARIPVCGRESFLLLPPISFLTNFYFPSRWQATPIFIWHLTVAILGPRETAPYNSFYFLILTLITSLSPARSILPRCFCRCCVSRKFETYTLRLVRSYDVHI
ncbi:hypothetical protein BC629DRAFT_119030 [Irpex lacteus]|nr:hypothetical protein BC629DRAFT_119030 [Irpex lacteus]